MISYHNLLLYELMIYGRQLSTDNSITIPRNYFSVNHAAGRRVARCIILIMDSCVNAGILHTHDDEVLAKHAHIH